MASVTNWIEHLTTDVDAVTEGVQVADIYPMVGTEWMWLTAAVVFWLAWHFATASGETESWLEKDRVLTIIKRILPSGNIK